MTVESATYISDLNSSYPAGTDAKSEGDNHIRLIKSTVKATFPNVNGAVSATDEELNYVDVTTLGTMQASKAVTADASNEVTVPSGGVVNFASGAELQIGGTVVTSTAAELNLLDGKTWVGPQLMTAASASSTAVDFTSIPAGVKRITVMMSGVSPTGTSASSVLVQIGTGGLPEATGYDSQSAYLQDASEVDVLDATTGFVVHSSSTASFALNGSMVLTLLDASSNLWTETHAFAQPEAAWLRTTHGAGKKALSGVLDMVRITFANGTETFDAGTINVMYE